MNKTEKKALAPLRVLDLTHYIAGPYCTKLLAGFGADVIKIERPGRGDKIRSMGPFYEQEQGLENSIPFLWLNTGKKSITLNLKKDEGIQIFKRLLAGADVVVENFSPRVMPGLGLDYKTIKRINPNVVMTSISNFGQTGPYRDYKAEEIVTYAMSGLMYITGAEDKPPLTSGPAITQYTAGQSAYLATLMALYKRGGSKRDRGKRGRNNQGQHIDVSIQECAMDLRQLTIVDHLNLETDPKRNSDRHSFCPWQAYPCKDGYAVIVGSPSRNWHSFADIVGEPKLADKRYDRMEDRIKRRKEVEALFKPWLETHTRQEIYEAGMERSLAFGYVTELPEVYGLKQHKARQYFMDVEHPHVGKHRYCGAPFRPSETPWNLKRAPLLGEHNEWIYCESLGYSKEEIKKLAEEGVI
jgi:crotonobetainyl-CoA:carnitine CoA-transferase CaiB-like acyl-CoA transferase